MDSSFDVKNANPCRTCDDVELTEKDKAAFLAWYNEETKKKAAEISASRGVCVEKNKSYRQIQTMKAVPLSELPPDQSIPTSDDASGVEAFSLAPTSVSRWGINKVWPVGTVLRVHFLDGQFALRSKVMQAAKQWSVYGNIHFILAPTADESDLRITFVGSNCWSYVGTDNGMIVDKSRYGIHRGRIGTYIGMWRQIGTAYMLVYFSYASILYSLTFSSSMPLLLALPSFVQTDHVPRLVKAPELGEPHYLSSPPSVRTCIRYVHSASHVEQEGRWMDGWMERKINR